MKHLILLLALLCSALSVAGQQPIYMNDQFDSLGRKYIYISGLASVENRNESSGSSQKGQTELLFQYDILPYGGTEAVHSNFFKYNLNMVLKINILGVTNATVAADSFYKAMIFPEVYQYANLGLRPTYRFRTYRDGGRLNAVSFPIDIGFSTIQTARDTNSTYSPPSSDSSGSISLDIFSFLAGVQYSVLVSSKNDNDETPFVLINTSLYYYSNTFVENLFNNTTLNDYYSVSEGNNDVSNLLKKSLSGWGSRFQLQYNAFTIFFDYRKLTSINDYNLYGRGLSKNNFRFGIIVTGEFIKKKLKTDQGFWERRKAGIRNR